MRNTRLVLVSVINLKTYETMKTISIKPDNEHCVSMNAIARVSEKLLKNNIRLNPNELRLCMNVAIETIREMEKQNITSYEGKLNDN